MGIDRSSRTPGASPIGGSRRLVASDSAKGAPVYAPDGNRLGRINHVMVDEATSEIVYAIVNFGSASSIGFETDHHPVPWSLLAYNHRFGGYEMKITDKQTARRT
jgi:sporulation protein YlmC with PRC-barrel domain